MNKVYGFYRDWENFNGVNLMPVDDVMTKEEFLKFKKEYAELTQLSPKEAPYYRTLENLSLVEAKVLMCYKIEELIPLRTGSMELQDLRDILARAKAMNPFVGELDDSDLDSMTLFKIQEGENPSLEWCAGDSDYHIEIQETLKNALIREEGPITGVQLDIYKENGDDVSYYFTTLRNLTLEETFEMYYGDGYHDLPLDIACYIAKKIIESNIETK